ncbi:hypothetical protein DQG23_18010 [Paenibacillus contaminans]|uniref:Uncharacterized protein n=1 Tax=Paenibacillus contaminans TaxID=450362 RepID=A0A329MIP0_9BACL|nr:hypothetical protein DQG23_18010 [Paenibacillus contaminans]
MSPTPVAFFIIVANGGGSQNDLQDVKRLRLQTDIKIRPKEESPINGWKWNRQFKIYFWQTF